MSDGRAKNEPPPPDYQFKKGQSGNPGGRPVGTRLKITAAFLNALAKDFDEHGKAAIRQCREDDPSTYVKVIAGLLPKEVELKRPLEDMDDEQLRAAVDALRSFLSGAEAADGVATPGESSSLN